MCRSDKEKLIDYVIGEAVIVLLREETPLSRQALIAQLNEMAATEPDEENRQAMLDAITAIRQQKRHRPDARSDSADDRGGFSSFFSGDLPADGTKKH